MIATAIFKRNPLERADFGRFATLDFRAKRTKKRPASLIRDGSEAGLDWQDDHLPQTFV